MEIDKNLGIDDIFETALNSLDENVRENPAIQLWLAYHLWFTLKEVIKEVKIPLYDE